MIAGIGTDIVAINRIAKALDRHGLAFACRVLTRQERIIFDQRTDQASWLAKRFVAKEAASKALGTGIGRVSFHHMEITNDSAGAPSMTFSGHALVLQQNRGIQSIYLSLSDEAEFAVAFVILEL